MSDKNGKNNTEIESQTGAQKKDARRKVIKSTLVGGAVISAGVTSKKWAKPAIDAVVLPAHAVTTGTGSSGTGVTTTGAATTTPMVTTTVTTTPAPNSNITMNMSYFDWTENIV